jgi:serine protease Do
LKPGTWNLKLILGLLVITFGAQLPSAQTQQPENDSGVTEQDLERAFSLQKAVVHAIGRCDKSVVAIARVSTGAEAGLLGPGGAPAPSDPNFVPSEYGSGVVIDSSGLILTNHHVLGDSAASEYYVWLEGKSYKAKGVVAADPWMDLAVLEIEAENLTVIEFGKGEFVRKGQFCIALGNPHAIARDGEPSASWGIISNTRRKAPVLGKPRDGLDNVHISGTLLQTDARMALGSSGGALIDIEGRLIGLTTMIVASVSDAASGGFAIPVDEDFRRVVSQLRRGKSPEYGFLGVVPGTPLNSASKGVGGVLIQSIIPNTPADYANLLLDDSVVEIDGIPVREPSDLSRIVGKKSPGTSIEVKLDRRGREVIKEIVLAKRYLDSRRPAISSVERPRWRGMIVDQPTAVPALIGRAHAIDKDGCVGVVEVEPESAAWQAGMRPGDFITVVGGERVKSVAEFNQQVARLKGPVEVVVTDGDRRGPRRRIP